MAAKFRKVDPRIWTDERFVSLDSTGKLLALWMLTTTRVNRCGIIIWSPGLASEETGISRDRVETVYHTVCDTLRWVRDDSSKTVFLARWWKYNCPDNPSAMKGALEDLHDLPNNTLKPALKSACDDIKPSLRTVYQTVLDTVSPQKQEQKQKKEKKQKQELESCPADAGIVEPIPMILDTPEFRTAWNDWLRLKSGKKLKPHSRVLQLRRLSSLSPAQAVACIESSLANGYEGLFPDKFKAKNNGTVLRDQFQANAAEFLERTKAQ